MPSVEMRRTTRVFGARVLRSGRRLFTSQEVIKHMKRPNLAPNQDWIQLFDHGDDDLSQDKIQLRKLGDVNSVKVFESDGDLTVTRRWGLVYCRKRKRIESTDDCDNKFGKKFFRKQSRNAVVMQPNSIETCSFVKTKSRKKAVKVSVSKPLNLPTRNGVQKRRSSLRLREQSNTSSFNSPQDGVLFFPVKSNPESIQRASYKELIHDIDSASCNASILVIESDRCYREKGGVISMEMSDSNTWFLVVKRNGVERFQVEARNVMRPCFINRVTHAIIWAGGDESWRLEFSDRKDWFIFKELYKECSKRTVRVQNSVASIIPVPRVNEVSDYLDEKYVAFKMPDSYIRSRGDEISRILEKSEPVYDMDSEDEEWLNKFNNGCHSRVDEDIFEKIIDAFERGIYFSQEDYSDETKAVDRCLMLAPKDVLEAVYTYWMARRKKKCSALVQAFQLYKPKNPEQLNVKAVLRKKRSFRQRGTQAGRGKRINFLKAALYEKTTGVEAENITNKVQETEQAANVAEQTAIMKRKQAQLLMEVADLLTYKAAIAVKIAEARAAPGLVEDNAIDELFFPL